MTTDIYNIEAIPHEELDVYATTKYEKDIYIGSIELPRVHNDYRDLPIELEIDGVIYHPQF